MRAYLLISTKPKEEEKVYNKLQKYEEIKKVNILFGSWDILAELDMKDVFDELNKKNLVK